MYLSAERMAIANQAVQETFEQTSIVWQAIPHWDTGDPGQLMVRSDSIDTPPVASMALEAKQVAFKATLADAIAPTPDPLLAQVIGSTALLASYVDAIVLNQLIYAKQKSPLDVTTLDKLLESLINARVSVEDNGYRAPSCLVTNTAGLVNLSTLGTGEPVTDAILGAAHVNALHRVTHLMTPYPPPAAAPAIPAMPPLPAVVATAVMLMIGRRQRIAKGAAAEASPGEEPVDLAVSVLPSLEVVGEDPINGNQIEMAVRIRFATRIKHKAGFVVLGV